MSNLEGVIESHTHPVAACGAKAVGPIDTEAKIGGGSSNGGSGAAGKSRCARRKDIFIQDVGIDMGGFIEGESQHIEIKVDVAMGGQLPCKAWSYLGSDRASGVENVIGGINRVVHLIAVPINEIVTNGLECVSIVT